MSKNIAFEKFKTTKLLAMDVDGVLTDGTIILGNGEEFKAFNIKDGHGIRVLIKSGIKVAIMSGRKSKAVKVRADELGIVDVHQEVRDKKAVLGKILDKYKINWEETVYIGDDLTDLAVMGKAGVGVAVADAGGPKTASA